MKKIRVAAAATVGALALSVTGLVANPAAADPATDAQTVLNNAPAAVQDVIDGVQAAVNAILNQEGTVEASNELINGLINAGVDLVAGTEQFGALGLGFGLAALGLQNALTPFLQAIDDPSLAPGLVNPEGDLNAILANLGPAVGTLTSNAGIGVAELLKGNLWVDGLLGSAGTPAAVGNVIAGIFGGLFAPGAIGVLVQGTTLQNLDPVLRIDGLVLGGALGGFANLAQVEAALAPLFEALGPVTAPVIAVVENL